MMETILAIIVGLAALYVLFWFVSTLARFALYATVILVGIEVVLRWGAQTSLLNIIGG